MRNFDLLLPDQARDDILALGDIIQNIVDIRLDQLWNGLEHEYQKLFETVGDMAYGKFNSLLFQPVRKAMTNAGLKASPRLPGSFQSSREWGNHDETHQQRWMTSKIIKDNGTVLGTIAIGSHHDHSRFRLPRSPEVIALRASRPKEVVAALSIIKPEFAEAEEFRVWYAKYLSEVSNIAADI